MELSEHEGTRAPAYVRLQRNARLLSQYFFIAAGVVFFGGAALIAGLMIDMARGNRFLGGIPTASFTDYAYVLLMMFPSVLLPVVLLAAIGAALRLYADAQGVREERHLEMLDAIDGGAAVDEEHAGDRPEASDEA